MWRIRRDLNCIYTDNPIYPHYSPTLISTIPACLFIFISTNTMHLMSFCSFQIVCILLLNTTTTANVDDVIQLESTEGRKHCCNTDSQDFGISYWIVYTVFNCFYIRELKVTKSVTRLLESVVFVQKARCWWYSLFKRMNPEKEQKWHLKPKSDT